MTCAKTPEEADRIFEDAFSQASSQTEKEDIIYNAMEELGDAGVVDLRNKWLKRAREYGVDQPYECSF